MKLSVGSNCEFERGYYSAMRRGLLITVLSCASVFGHAQESDMIRPTEVRFNFIGNTSVAPTVEKECSKELMRQTLRRSAWRDEAAEHAKICFQDHGYFMAAVVPEIQTDSGKAQLYRVVLQVDVGHQFRLASIGFRQTEPFDGPTFQAMFDFRPGDIFSRKSAAVGLERMRAFYAEHGYIDFTPLPNAQVDPVHDTVDVLIDIDAGRQYKVGGVAFDGLSSAEAARLSAKLNLKVGDVFDGRKISEFYERNKAVLPRNVTAENSFKAVRDASDAKVYLKFDFLR